MVPCTPKLPESILSILHHHHHCRLLTSWEGKHFPPFFSWEKRSETRLLVHIYSPTAFLSSVLDESGLCLGLVITNSLSVNPANKWWSHLLEALWQKMCSFSTIPRPEDIFYKLFDYFPPPPRCLTSNSTRMSWTNPMSQLEPPTSDLWVVYFVLPWNVKSRKVRKYFYKFLKY